MTSIEVKAFAEVRALLKPNQTSRSAEAFVLMAGLFHPSTTYGGPGRAPSGGALLYADGFGAPQGRGGGRGTGGGTGGGNRMGGGPNASSSTRLVALASVLGVVQSDRKQIKEVLDPDYKSAGPLRDQLFKTRNEVGQAIQNGAGATVVDEGVAEYAKHVAAMALAEMKALAKILAARPPDQRPSSREVEMAAYLMRGAFIGKKWDTVPDSRFY